MYLYVVDTEYIMSFQYIEQYDMELLKHTHSTCVLIVV